MRESSIRGCSDVVAMTIAANPMVLFSAALILRLLWIAFAGLGAPALAGDAAQYWDTARGLASAGLIEGWRAMPAQDMPLYPFFLSLVIRVAGPFPEAARLVQAVMGAFSCLLLYGAAQRLFSARAALIAGWSAAFYFGLVDPCARILTESFFSFWLCALLWAWARWEQEPRARLVAGASTALYLTRPEGALAGAVFGVAGLWARRGWKLRHTLLIAACGVAAVMAWGLRNKAAVGVFMPGTTGAGYSLWAALPRTMNQKLGLPQGAFRQSPPGAGELEWNEFYRLEAQTALKASSAGAIVKAAAFNLVSQFYPFLPRFELTYGLLALLWLYGAWVLRGRRELQPALALVGLWAALYVVFGGADSRFRQLYAPVLVLLAAGGGDALLERWGRGRFVKIGSAWAGANVFLFLFSDRLRAAALAARDILWGPR